MRLTSTVKELEIQRRSNNNWRNEPVEFVSETTPTTESLSNTAGSTTYSSLTSALQSKISRSCIESNFNNSRQDIEGETRDSEGNWEEYRVGNTRYRKREITKTKKIISSIETGTKYSCPDRVTMLKKSMYDLIAGNSTVSGHTTTITPLVETASIGFTRFPNPSVTRTPLVLNTENRTTLLSAITGYSNSSGTPIAHAYATGAAGLMANMPTGAEAACAGYGVYFLTDGEPWSDSTSSARSAINSYLSTATTSTNCGSSWPCVTTIAEKLKLKQNTKNIEIKTAVVGFGNEFSFGSAVYNPLTIYKYSGTQTANDTTDLRNLFTGNALEAAKASIVGGGGWYSAANTTDIVNSVQNFVESIRVEIPAITTGTSAIPQDALNTNVIQPYSYFPQFQPKPSEDEQSWIGNLKKYKVAGGLLKDKNDANVFSSDGVLNPANEDLWTPNYASNAQLTEYQQKLKTLGGVLSRLSLKNTDSNLNRKVFTNTGATLNAVTQSYIAEAPTTRGYLLGLLGYKITDNQVSSLTDTGVGAIIAGTTPAEELRQVGAVMHSTPVLLTQSGKITYSNNTVNTENRDDYILFGTTQGVLHVVKAGTVTEAATTSLNNTAGNEVFAFVPQEMLASQPTALLDPKETPQNGMDNLYYGVDGQWTAHTEYVYVPGTDEAPEGTFKVYEDDNKYGKQWVYGGLRMGGKSYYALDLTRLTASTNNQPVIKFRINPEQSRVDGFTHAATENSRYANLAKMGQSWSKPTLAHVQWKGKRRLVMFVGGGYDPGYEDFKYDQENGVGAGVYMFDADTGEFLWSTYDAKLTPTEEGKTLIGDGDHLKYSVVSQIKTVDREGDGDIDHLYFGDLGGQVFRIDLDKNHAKTDTATNFAKQITRIYNGHIDGGYSPRFYEMPAFTVYNGSNGLFAVISIGSGNRSTPLLGKKVNDQYIVSGEEDDDHESLIDDAIYNIYDKVVVMDKPHEATLPVTSPTISNLFEITDSHRELAATSAASPIPLNLAANKENSDYKGWFYAFTSSVNVGNRKAVEKVQGDLIAIDNDLYVSTFDAEGVGTTESCGAGIYGNSRAHRFCMPYGQCEAGDTVAANTIVLGKGLLGITVGPGTNSGDRRIIAPVSSLDATKKITSINYAGTNRLIPQSWYEKN